MENITLRKGFQDRYDLINKCFIKENLYKFFWKSLELEKENNEVSKETKIISEDYLSNKKSEYSLREPY
ncbi:hypothetical protein KAJ87_04515 [Candidatus Pacearchaeota archaeon]|nr:hypothetical protein [Candidatus Pacearchaeota archaeon]